jgi:hypothetical protein
MRSGLALPTVSILLGVSVLLNFVLLRRQPDEGPARSRAAAPSAVPQVPAAPAPAVLAPAEPAPLRAASSSAPAAPVAARSPAPPSSIRNDPRVAEVLDAQEKFGAFWKDLGPLFKAKGKLDDAKYFQTVVGSTSDFLELGEPVRTQFHEAARFGVAALRQARRDYDAARAALPVRNKADVAAEAVYQDRKNAVDGRYQEQVDAAVKSVVATLDPARPRHAEFAAEAGRWLKSLVTNP